MTETYPGQHFMDELMGHPNTVDVRIVDDVSPEKRYTPPQGGEQSFQIAFGMQPIQILTQSKFRNRATIIIVGLTGTLADAFLVLGDYGQVSNGQGATFISATANGGNYSFTIEHGRAVWANWTKNPNGGGTTTGVWLVNVIDERYE